MGTSVWEYTSQASSPADPIGTHEGLVWQAGRAAWWYYSSPSQQLYAINSVAGSVWFPLHSAVYSYCEEHLNVSLSH